MPCPLQRTSQKTRSAYEAFGAGDLDGAIETWPMTSSGSCPGTARSAASIEAGTRWRRFFQTLASKSFRTEPQHFIADGDHVAVLTRITADGQSSDQADVLTFGPNGELPKFTAAADTTLQERIWGKRRTLPPFLLAAGTSSTSAVTARSSGSSSLPPSPANRTSDLAAARPSVLWWGEIGTPPARHRASSGTRPTVEKMDRRTFLTSIAAAVATGLAGCGADATPGQSPGGAAAHPGRARGSHHRRDWPRPPSARNALPAPRPHQDRRPHGRRRHQRSRHRGLREAGPRHGAAPDVLLQRGQLGLDEPRGPAAPAARRQPDLHREPHVVASRPATALPRRGRRPGAAQRVLPPQDLRDPRATHSCDRPTGPMTTPSTRSWPTWAIPP